MSEAVETYRWSVDEYHKLIGAGVFTPSERIELLDGKLLVMSPIGKRHAKAVRNLLQAFRRCTGERCVIDCQNPVILDLSSEPQPDILLLRPEMDESQELPRPADIFLVVEVADTSLGYDRGVKLQAYANAGLSEVWIVNLPDDAVECYRDSDGRMYKQVHLARRDDLLNVEALPGVVVPVADLLR